MVGKSGGGLTTQQVIEVITLRLAFKLWLDNGGKAFGDGPYDILKRVQDLGSLRKAAQEMGMSYSQAWELIRRLEGRLGFPLLERKVGGSSGGGSSITPQAQDLMQRYQAFRNEAEEMLDNLFNKYFSEPNPQVTGDIKRGATQKSRNLG